MNLKLRSKITLFFVSSIFIFFIIVKSLLHHSFTPEVSRPIISSLTILTFAFAVVLSLICYWLIGLWVGDPLKRIVSSVRVMGGERFDKTIYVSDKNELRDLAEAINQMSQEVQSKINELISTKSRLEAVFLSMFEGVMLVDQEGRILLMNNTLNELMGANIDPVGRKPLEIIRNVEIQKLTDRVLKVKKGVESMELTVLLPEEKIILVHATPVLRNNETEGAVLVFHDITQLRRLESVRRDFVANVSHELRTPVSTIKGYAETLLEGALEDKENARDFVGIIYADAERLAKLINELLDLSQIESGNMKFNFVPCYTHLIIESVFRTLSKKIKEKYIRVKNNIPENLTPIFADETSITQVFLNLIENAIKYNKDEGLITVSAKDLGQSIEISITDTGIGIPEEDLPRIFERFYRVDKAHSRQLGSTGLGLSIVKHLVNAHQGEIFVESVLGQGSTFRLILPKLG